MKDFCEKHNLTEAQFLGKEEIKGSLYLEKLTSIPEGFNPTVGGSLYLENLTSIPEGFNPTVGGYLDLRSLTSIPEGFNPTVGGSLDLGKGLKCNKTEIDIDNTLLSWMNGKYIKIDGIFTEVISKRGNVLRVKKIGKDKTFYLVSDGNNKYAHGDTLKEAREDLTYKVTDRRKSDYENHTLESVLTFEESIACYRTITGVCSFGTKDFVKNRLGKKKKEYTIQEIINVTDGEYMSLKFKEFFPKTTSM